MQSLHQNLRSVPLKSVGGRGFVVPPPPPNNQMMATDKRKIKVIKTDAILCIIRLPPTTVHLLLLFWNLYIFCNIFINL